MSDRNNNMVQELRKMPPAPPKWRELLDLTANLWDVFSMISVFIGGAIIIILKLTQVDTSAQEIISILIGIACAMIPITITSAWIAWTVLRRSRLDQMLGRIHKLNLALRQVIQIMLEEPDKQWVFRELRDTCRDHGATFSNISELDELRRSNLIRINTSKSLIYLTEPCKQYRDYISPELGSLRRRE